jgi:hypothetical protein
LRHRQLQAVGEQHAVGQLGQRIEVGQVLKPLLVLLDQRDVGKNGDEVGDFTIAVADVEMVSRTTKISPDFLRFQTSPRQ